MTDEDWGKLFADAKRQREKDLANNETAAALDAYNRMVQEIYRTIQYKNVTELLQYRFIDVYDISCLTNVPLKDIKCIQIYLENSR